MLNEYKSKLIQSLLKRWKSQKTTSKAKDKDRIPAMFVKEEGAKGQRAIW